MGLLSRMFLFAAGFALQSIESDACHGISVRIRRFNFLGSRRNYLGVRNAVVVLRVGRLGYGSWRLGWLQDRSGFVFRRGIFVSNVFVCCGIFGS